MVGMILPMLIGLVLAAHIGQSGTLTFTKPAAWTDRAAASLMRVAEFVVPRASGDAEDGELIVYYFGGTGGSVEANLERWTSQFQSAKEPIRTSSVVNGLKLTSLDVSGTVHRRGASRFDGAPQQTCVPDARHRRGDAEGTLLRQTHRTVGNHRQGRRRLRPVPPESRLQVSTEARLGIVFEPQPAR